jgi:hypothetical protein
MSIRVEELRDYKEIIKIKEILLNKQIIIENHIKLKKNIIIILLKWENFLLKNEFKQIVEIYLKNEIIDTIYIIMEDFNESNMMGLSNILNILIFENEEFLENLKEEVKDKKRDILLRILISLPEKVMNIKNFNKIPELTKFLPK